MIAISGLACHFGSSIPILGTAHLGRNINQPWFINHTVDGRNPAPPWMVETLFRDNKGMFTIYQLVQDFATIPRITILCHTDEDSPRTMVKYLEKLLPHGPLPCSPWTWPRSSPSCETQLPSRFRRPVWEHRWSPRPIWKSLGRKSRSWKSWDVIFWKKKYERKHQRKTSCEQTINIHPRLVGPSWPHKRLPGGCEKPTRFLHDLASESLPNQLDSINQVTSWGHRWKCFIKILPSSPDSPENCCSDPNIIQHPQTSQVASLW